MVSGIRNNVNRTQYQKNCLLKYIVGPFDDKITCHWHQNLWQVPELALILGEFGYNVDAVNYTETVIPAEKQYDLLIDIHPAKPEVYRNNLKDDCGKIVYATGAGFNWQNRQVNSRINALNVRRGVNLDYTTHIPVAEADLNNFDALFMFGNQFTRRTFGDIKIKQTFFIRNTGYPFLFPESFAGKSPRNFLFFASWPQVLKGLDLLLEVFARNPDLVLYVCSLFKNEPEFCAIYEQELYHTPNIIPVGFINIESELFRQISGACSYVILPSCSEAAAGSVLTAMSAGIVPLVSRECGFNDDEVIHLENCSIPCLEETVREYAAKSHSWIASQSQKAVDIIRSRYSPAHYTKSVQQAIHGFLSQEKH